MNNALKSVGCSQHIKVFWVHFQYRKRPPLTFTTKNGNRKRRLKLEGKYKIVEFEKYVVAKSEIEAEQIAEEWCKNIPSNKNIPIAFNIIDIVEKKLPEDLTDNII